MMTIEFLHPNSSDVPDTGRRRVMPLFTVYKLKESHASIHAMFEALTFPKSFEYVLSPDLKALNLVLGLSTGASKHPCYGCDFSATSTAETTPRTVQSIKDNFENFSGAGPKAQQKDFLNCIAMPISMLPSLSEIVSYVAPPALHLLLGIFAWLFGHLCNAFAGAEEWPKMLYLLREGYHGGKYNGNACRKMLKNIHLLEELLAAQKVSRSKTKLFLLYISCFKALNNVVRDCFGKKLYPTWKKSIFIFKETILELFAFCETARLPSIKKNLPSRLTPKLHILFCHVIPWCETRGVGMGSFSEQSFETAHHDFFKIWEHFKVTDPKSPIFRKRLLKTVLVFASGHLPTRDTIDYMGM